MKELLKLYLNIVMFQPDVSTINYEYKYKYIYSYI